MNSINNLSVKAKLRSLVGLMLVFSLIIGSLGTFGLIQANRLDGQLYEEQTKPLAIISEVIQNLLTASSSFDMAILASDDPAAVEEYRLQVEALNKETEQLLADYRQTITSEEIKGHFDAAATIFYDVFLPNSPQVFALLQEGDVEGADDLMGTIDVKIGEMIDGFDKIQDMNVQNASQKRHENMMLTRTVVIVLISLFVVGLVVVLLLGIAIAASISRPMESLARLARGVGGTGNLRIEDALRQELEEVTKRTDEFGQTTGAFSEMFTMLLSKADELDLIATGNLSDDIQLKSDCDTMGISIRSMQEQLSTLFGDIIQSAEQVSNISEQIANGSQALAQGATEQAESVEQASASISMMTEKSNNNAALAKEAADLEKNILKNAEGGSQKMEHMVVAVKDINEASLAIQKVIKVIDDIAFQTNILALNAAVEAARAGQHGKGFAVVADEVRNLAAKSADAAKETSALIANTIEKANMGVGIADETAKALGEIVTGINESSKIIANIADISEEQSAATAGINTQIEQVAVVIQQNSATAQQSAAASEEMNSQAVMLHRLIGRFKIKQQPGASKGLNAAPTQAPQYLPPATTAFQQNTDDVFF